eukprot:scaffold164679_cov27-Prasinocladus_malaysianus.AAC.1
MLNCVAELGDQRPDELRLHGPAPRRNSAAGPGAAVRPGRPQRPRRAHQAGPADGGVPPGPHAVKDVARLRQTQGEGGREGALQT